METGTVAQTLLNDVASQAKAALSRSRIFDLRRLSVEQDGDYVVLRGRVDSFYHKQLAQELVRAAVEGIEVLNAISVIYHRERQADYVDWRW
jgi:osmotically-inducible protein OsmY